MEIKPVLDDQRELLADMSRQTFYNTFASFNEPVDMELFMEKQFGRKELIEELDLPNLFFFIAWENEKPLGYIKMKYWQESPYSFLPQEPTMEISRIYANTDVIGKGVGKALMQFALDHAKQIPVNHIWLGVWEKNERALKFYSKWGFEEKGSHPFLLGTDLQTDLLMVKQLSTV